MGSHFKRVVYVVGGDEFEIVWHGAADSGTYNIEKNGKALPGYSFSWIVTRLRLRRLMRRQSEINTLKLSGNSDATESERGGDGDSSGSAVAANPDKSSGGSE